MKTTRLTKGLNIYLENLPIDPTADNIELASVFVFEMWKSRWREQKNDWEEKVGSTYYIDEPTDLSGSCKFSSIFAALVFDADIDGNGVHQFAVKKGRIIDLNSGAADVTDMSAPYALDALFFGTRDHIASMTSCMPRILEWVQAFDLSLSPRPMMSDIHCRP
jgi:hypothetical protein